MTGPSELQRTVSVLNDENYSRNQDIMRLKKKIKDLEFENACLIKCIKKVIVKHNNNSQDEFTRYLNELSAREPNYY